MTNVFKTIIKGVKHWYLPMIIGILFVTLGIYIFTVPEETYLTLTYIFSISFIVSGLIEIFFSLRNKEIIDGWGWYFTGGLVNLIIGIILITNPMVSIVILPYYVAFSLLFKSIQSLGISFDMKDYGISSWGNLAAASFIGIIFSILLIYHPLLTGLSLITFTALAFIFTGINSIILSILLKKLKDLPSKLSDDFKIKFESLRQDFLKEIRKK